MGQVADYINNFFLEIGPKLAASLDSTWEYKGVIADENIKDIEATQEEIIDISKKININKSSGMAHIPTWILKRAFITKSDIVTNIVNSSFTACKCPDLWKVAGVVPLQKDGNKQLVSNLRPSSRLPVQSKIIEKIVHSKISEYLNNLDLLCKEQGGFRKGHSTVSTASFFVNEIYKAMNEKEYLLVTYLDIKKAFDTVNHNILLKKCQKLGIHGNLLKWLENYLINRKQSTTANNITSETGDIVCGVPRGSILGLLLFLIYINDIDTCLTSTTHFLYADDTVLLCKGKDLDSMCRNMRSDLDNIFVWCKSNKLTIN